MPVSIGGARHARAQSCLVVGLRPPPRGASGGSIAGKMKTGQGPSSLPTYSGGGFHCPANEAGDGGDGQRPRGTCRTRKSPVASPMGGRNGIFRGLFLCL